jgi:CheY-like chemotaxis protein
MAYQFKNISVLIVESSTAMYNITKSVLESFGVQQVHSAFGSAQGFEKFCAVKPDLVIVDWLDDPDNGIELTKKIRIDPKSPNPFTPVILMTGYSQKRRVIMARDSGITEFLMKPFTAKALYQRIEQMVEFPRSFIRTSEYFGPDRRRKKDSAGYSGPERRKN